MGSDLSWTSTTHRLRIAVPPSSVRALRLENVLVPTERVCWYVPAKLVRSLLGGALRMCWFARGVSKSPCCSCEGLN